MIYIPFIGAFALASLTLLEKLVLRKRKINIKSFQVLAFLSSVIIMLPFIYFFWNVNNQAFELKNILLFLLVILFSICANLLSFYAVKWEKITNIEPAKMLEPLFTILIAIAFSFFIPELYERNFQVIIPAIIAGCALIFSHIRKHHLDFNKYFLAAILASLLFSIEMILTRLILDLYSPLSFYFSRCLLIFIISLIIFRPKLKGTSPKIKIEILLVGLSWVIFRLATYYGYLYLGVISTTLVLMLGPVLVYIFARTFLKEKLDWRNITSAIIILGCVLYAVLG